MKKFSMTKKTMLASVLLVAIIMAISLSVLAQTADNAVKLYSDKNGWYVGVPSAGTVTVMDNKTTYTYAFDKAGTFMIGLQKGYTGQLKYIGFKPEIKGYNVYLWTDDMKIGDALIDTQHKELINMINELLVACYYGQPPSELHEMLIEIANDSVQHFADEEELMQTVGYPGYLEHKKIHDDFLAVVIEALEMVDTQGPSADLISEITTTVGNWVINHILRADVQITL